MSESIGSWCVSVAACVLLDVAATEIPAAVPCWDDLPMHRPSVVFIGRATATTLDAPVLGAGRRLESRFSGSVRAQVFEVDQLAGRDRSQVPLGSQRFIVVPWGYAADCTPQRWSSERWVEPGTSGLVHGRLRARQYWVEGLPTIDVREPYQLPYPRSADRPLTIPDAFTLLSLLPASRDLDERGTEALRPLAEWIRGRPELASAEPGRYLRSFLIQFTFEEVRKVQLQVAGTYRFTLDYGDGELRTFYGRTEAHAYGPDRMEEGTAFMDELRPPRAERHLVFVGVARESVALPADRSSGNWALIRVNRETEVQSDGTRRWGAHADPQLMWHAFTRDEARAIISAIPRDLWTAPGNNPSPSDPDAAFILEPSGRLTFRQRFRIPGRPVAVLQGERISGVVMSVPREERSP